jgi:uncharacterized protein (TIGR03663 family)
MNRWQAAGLALLLLLGLGLRAPRLDLRPMHNDEGTGAIKFRQLYVENNYKYDPNEYHGPTLAYATLPAAWVQGGGDFNEFNEATYRSVTVAFGLGLILLLPLLGPEFGRAEMLWAAALTALSPAMVFYSRYYIHEMLLVFFTAWTFISFWRYANSGRAAWALAGGIGLGLMWATKETFVLAVAAMALAAGTCAIWGDAMPRRWKSSHLVVAVLAAGGVGALFFSSFLTNASGPLHALQTYVPWLHRARGAAAHVHPWSFYFHRLLWFHVRGGPVWSEGFVAVLALAGFAGALRGQSLLGRLIAFYTFWLMLIYTLIPYKTPWCLLGFYHGMILLAGMGAALLWRAAHPSWLKVAAAVVLAAGMGDLGWQSWRGNFGVDAKDLPYCDSPGNPYVYSQTLPDAMRLVGMVGDLARVSPQGTNTVMEVMSPESYWPLPWYLRRFPNVGYWEKIPDQPPAPIMIVSAGLHATFDQGPDKTHLMAGYYELRPQVFLELYVETNLWTAYVKTKPPEKD